MKHGLGLLEEWEMDIPITIYAGPDLIAELMADFYYKRAGLSVIRLCRPYGARKKLLENGTRGTYVIEEFPNDTNALERRMLIRERKGMNKGNL
jgi:hypothetical protein